MTLDVPMRIAQFTESFRPVINGVAVAVGLLSEELAPEHHVEIFAPGFPGYTDPDTPAGQPCVHVHRFPSYRVPGHADYPLAIPFSPTLRSWFGQAHFDVVHTHSPFALGQAARRWARAQRVPLVTTYHTLYVEYAHYARGVPSGLSRAFLRRLSRSYCNSVDAVAVPTEPIREVLFGYGVRRPIHVVPTGLRLRPPAAPDPRFPRGELGIPAEAPLVLYAGRLAREKNLELLFEAFGRVARALPSAWLLLCGSGPEEAAAKRLASETGAMERIAFAGFVAPERMAQVYAAADVFAFSSLTDTQGLVVTEAKAAGLPVVSVDAYGPSTVVRDGIDGYLTLNDREAFSSALVRLLQDAGLRACMREAALQEAQRYSIAATADAYLALYEEAIHTVKR
jgi:1,2-diacylglycerol 3-alpha-glucosyltransferase